MALRNVECPDRFMEFLMNGGSLAKQRTGCIVVGVYEGGKLSPSAMELDSASGHALDAAGFQQPGRDVGGRCAENVGHHQDALALVEVAHQVLGHRQDRIGLVVDGHAQLAKVGRAAPQHVARGVDQRFAKGAVGDDEQPDHGAIL